MERILLAYSGDLASSIALASLRDRPGVEVVALVVDVGQDRQLEDVRDRALALGAIRAHVIDTRDAFAREVILPALQAGALDERRPELIAALSRPTVARQLVEVARIEGATAVAHAGTGDQPTLTALVRALDPSLKIAAPLIQAGLTRWADIVASARQRGIAMAIEPRAAAVVDANIWGRTVLLRNESDDWSQPAEDRYVLTRAADETPDQAAIVEIEFAHGEPIRINGVAMSLVELIQSLETIAGSHGIGRLFQHQRSASGASVHRIVEAPAAVVLHAAHREVQRAVIAPDLDRLASTLAVTYGDLIQNGGWFTASRAALDAFVTHVKQSMSGVARLRLFRGDCRVVAVHPAVSSDLQPVSSNLRR
jgi:argininosuccinate synthase